MTKRFWIVAMCGAVSWSVNVRAQSGAANSPAPVAAQFVNADTGMTLADAIARALAQEPTLRSVRTEVDIAKGERVQAGLRPNPSVSFMQQFEPGGTDSQTRVEMEWPLDLSRKDGRVAVADRALEANAFAVSDRERLLAAEVRMKYGEVVSAVRDLSVGDDLIATTTRQAELLRARVDQGAIPPLERNIVEVELRRLEADRLLQAGRADTVLFELKRLVGLTATAPLQLRDSLEALVLRDVDGPSLPSSAAAGSRADVQEAEARILVADAQIDRVRRDGRFDLSVLGSYMRMDAGFPQLGFTPQGDLTRVRGLFHYFSVGAMMTVPLRNQNQGVVTSAQAERAGAAARLEAVQLTAEAEIAAASARDQRARSAIAIYTGGARELARQNLDVVSQTYELGRATVFDVLAEQRRYLDFEHAYSNALREAYEARTALRRALGEVR
jgi:outer membrane protein, heavy metal efflux system